MPAKKTAKKRAKRTATRTKKAVKKTRKTVRKAAKNARAGVTKAERKTTNVLDKVEHELEDAERKGRAAGVHLKYKMLDAKDAVEKGVERSEAWVKNNPIKAVLGALALGWLVGKTGRRKKK